MAYMTLKQKGISQFYTQAWLEDNSHICTISILRQWSNGGSNNGYEIQIDGLDEPAGNPLHKTGAICRFAAPNELVSKPARQWNTLEVHTIEQNYTVIIMMKRQ